MVHLTIFGAVQAVFLVYSTDGFNELVTYLTDLSWIEAGSAAESPYANETMYSISMLWGIVFIADFLYSWSYTVFPAKSGRE